jgi:ribosome biogenesis GTPase
MFPARIVADYGQTLRVIAESGELLVNRPLNRSENNLQLAVGDWVALEYTEDSQWSCIKFVLTRKTKFSRAAAGIEVKEQIVAANVDTVFLTQSLNRDFNMKRLERYLIAAWESGAVPVVVLTKADCCENVADKISAVYVTAPGVEVYAISCVTGEGIEELKKYFMKGKTVALLGSSGVGKSTLVNTLAGKELLKTQEIRNDDRGKHTTTHRELLLLPEGGLVLDTPGMRSLSLWEADSGMEAMFGDVEELTKMCRFSDCKHLTEPGCAVREAIETGRLEMKRWESWLKLQKELAHLEAKKEGKLRFLDKQWGRQIAKYQK